MITPTPMPYSKFRFHFYTDSFYTTLAQTLFEKKGICRHCTEKLSGMLDALKNDPTHEPKFVFKDPILGDSFKDRKDVRMLSTVHGTDLFEHATHAFAM